MDDPSSADLLAALLRQSEEQTALLKSIDSRLVEVVHGLATVASMS